MVLHHIAHRRVTFVALSLIFCCSSVFAARRNWQRKEVDLRAGSRGQIKAIYSPDDKPVLMRVERKKIKAAKRAEKKTVDAQTVPAPGDEKTATASVLSYTIDSPPVDGFVPWIAVTATDKQLEDSVFNAETESSIDGSFMANNPVGNFVIGLFDTGASAHVMGYESANTLGIAGEYLTDNFISVSGVNGEVDVWVSQPLSIFIDGLDVIEPNGMSFDKSGFMGQSNVAIAVGMEPIGIPDLPTAIGSPMAVYYTASFRNDQEVTINHGGEEYTAPSIDIFEVDDPTIPNYPNAIPLELRPLGALSISYSPDLDDIFNLEFIPANPSVIMGVGSQSLYFVHSVDMTDGTYSAIDKDRFMLDTGAQVTVIGSRIAARLGIDPADPEFEVEIVGVTGEPSTAPGFYIDSLAIPALGEWLIATNVPVILIDIASPEGGTLDGIIGMNLFVDCNIVVRGGGLFLQDDPMLEFEFIGDPLDGDISPAGGDGVVNMLDLAALASCWLALPGDANWMDECDIAPVELPDGKVDMLDFAALAKTWAN